PLGPLSLPGEGPACVSPCRRLPAGAAVCGPLTCPRQPTPGPGQGHPTRSGKRQRPAQGPGRGRPERRHAAPARTGGRWTPRRLLMTDFTRQCPPELEAAFWRLYRDFFDLAERRRRWSLEKDIPWAQCNRGLDPAIADVVESFCAVELYLPDYLANALPRSRTSRARSWFYANCGYEESKHSLPLGR